MLSKKKGEIKMNNLNKQRASELTRKITEAVKTNVEAYSALTKETKDQMNQLINEMRSPYNAVKEVYDGAMKKALELKRSNETIVDRILQQERENIPAKKEPDSIKDLIALQKFRDKLTYTPSGQLASLANESLTEEQIFALKAEMARRSKEETDENLQRMLKDSILSIQYEEPGAYIDEFRRDLQFARINNAFPYANAADAVNSIPMQEQLGFPLVQQAYEISQSVGTRQAAGSNTFFG